MSQLAPNTQLLKELTKLGPGKPPVRAPLLTSSRILRRVTDGIYREPWAALRELISNAYDADATSVEITTDPPWFRRITVRDNGNGFSRETLALTLQNIGESQKRESAGSARGVTSIEDSSKSPGGRRLIGKLGIGLFAVSHLAPSFRIVTKARGERYRCVADIVLDAYREDSPDGRALPDSESLRAGEVAVSVIPAEDVEAHGTDIIIDSIRPKTRENFQSIDLWASTRPMEDSVPREPPPYHIGVPAKGTVDKYDIVPVVPWKEGDTAAERFRALAQAMFDRADAPSAGRKPSLGTTFDNYFRFVWLLSLGAPLDYLDKHPFDLNAASGVRFYRLGPLRGQATEIRLPKRVSLRKHLHLRAPERGRLREFRVVIDGLELRRPIRTIDLKGSGSVSQPLLFVGTDNPDLSGYASTRTGGPLQFEGYLLWCHRVVPFDHAGMLVRVGDASGSLFDSTFMNYPVSEQKRKEQVVGEVYALQGLDAAINIDRESFNRSHPHYQYVSRWVHDAFRQFANKHKDVGKSARTVRLARQATVSARQLHAAVVDIVERRTDGEEPIKIDLVEDATLFSARKGVYALSREAILQAIPTGLRTTTAGALRFQHREGVLKGVLQVLHAAGLLDRMSGKEAEDLAVDLARVIFAERGE